MIQRQPKPQLLRKPTPEPVRLSMTIPMMTNVYSDEDEYDEELDDDGYVSLLLNPSPIVYSKLPHKRNIPLFSKVTNFNSTHQNEHFLYRHAPITPCSGNVKIQEIVPFTKKQDVFNVTANHKNQP